MRRAVSVTEWVLGEPSTLRAIERVARLGFEAIELSGDAALDMAATRDALARHAVAVTSICGLSHPSRDYADRSHRLRQAACDYLKACLEHAQALGAGVVIVVPTYRVDDPLTVDREGELSRAAETISRAAGGLSDGDPKIVLEALNRYETHLLRTLDDADELRRRIGSSQVRLMADLFHMNIEEATIEQSLRDHAGCLEHLHVADSQRREPGSGHLDLASIAATLNEVNYDHAVTMEFLPAPDNALLAGRRHVETLLSAPA